jgi:hypothetical protein
MTGAPMQPARQKRTLVSLATVTHVAAPDHCRRRPDDRVPLPVYRLPVTKPVAIDLQQAASSRRDLPCTQRLVCCDISLYVCLYTDSCDSASLSVYRCQSVYRRLSIAVYTVAIEQDGSAAGSSRRREDRDHAHSGRRGRVGLLAGAQDWSARPVPEKGRRGHPKGDHGLEGLERDRQADRGESPGDREHDSVLLLAGDEGAERACAGPQKGQERQARRQLDAGSGD